MGYYEERNRRLFCCGVMPLLYHSGICIEEPWFRKFNRLNSKHRAMSLKASYGVVPLAVDIMVTGTYYMDIRVIAEGVGHVWGLSVSKDGCVSHDKFDSDVLLFGGTRRKLV